MITFEDWKANARSQNKHDVYGVVYNHGGAEVKHCMIGYCYFVYDSAGLPAVMCLRDRMFALEHAFFNQQEALDYAAELTREILDRA